MTEHGVVEPGFVGMSRIALVEGLLALYDEVAARPEPRWVSLEAPSGWGKTRVARELYARIAARQPQPRYWPATLLTDAGSTAGEVTTRRKWVNPVVTHTPGSLPSFTWWGISCSVRNGLASVALAQDAATLEAHAPFLEDAWRKLPTASLAATDARAFGLAVLDEAAMEVGGRVVEAALGTAVPGLGLVRWLGECGWGKAKQARERKARLASDEMVSADHTALGDSLVAMLTRLSRPGLPTVLFVEDLHDADELLLEVLERVVASSSSILVITTGWPGHLDEGETTRRVMASAEGRLIRITAGGAPLPAPFSPAAGLTALENDALIQMLRFYYPQVTAETAERVVVRYPNPLALELFCQIPGIRRRFSDRPLELSDRDLARLPSSIRDLYRQLWRELPEEVRHALAIATLGIPAVLDPEAGRSHWWNADLVADALQILELPDERDVERALRDAPTAYAWARVVTDVLRQFVEPDQLAIAGEERAEYLMDWETDEVKDALAARAAERLRRPETPEVEREHGARLLLALHAEGFVTDPTTMGLATIELLDLLADQPLELGERIRLAERALPRLDPNTLTALDVRRRLGRALIEDGRDETAAQVLTDLRHQRVALNGAEDRESLSDGYEYAAALARAAPTECDDQLPELIGTARKLLGELDPLTLRIHNLSAYVAWMLDHLDEALRLNTELLERRSQALGRDHRDTLISASNRANCLIWMGHYGQAHDLATDTLRRRLRVLGPSHQDTLLSRQELARLAGLTGRTTEAVALRRELLRDKADALGLEHPDTLWAQSQLAEALAASGELTEALEVQGDLLERHIRRSGEDADITVDAFSTLADLGRQAGKLRHALELHEEALARTARRYGMTHQRTLEQRRKIAFARIGLVPMTETVTEYLELNRDAEASLPKGDWVRDQIALELGTRLGDAGRVGEAVKILEVVWQQRLAVQPAAATARADPLKLLIEAYLQAGEREKALTLLDEHLPTLIGELGPRAESIIWLRVQPIRARGEQDPKQAVRDCHELLADLSEYPRAHAVVIYCRRLLAWALRLAGEASEASERLQTLTLELLHSRGAGHPQVIENLKDLLDVVRSLPDAVEGALAVCTQVVDAARETMGPRSPQFRGLLTWASTVAFGHEDGRPEILQWRAELVNLLENDTEPDELWLAEARVHFGYGLLMAEELQEATDQLVTGATALHLLDPRGVVTVAGRRLAAIALGVLGRWDEAIAFRRQNVEVLEAAAGADPDELANSRRELEAALAEQASEAAD